MRTTSHGVAVPDADPSDDQDRPGWLGRLLGPGSLLEGAQHLPWHRSAKLALWLGLVSTVLGVTVGFLGPSVVTLSLGERTSVLPSYYLDLSPLRKWPIAYLTYFAVFCGFLATVLALRAQTAGWRPNNRKLFAAGIVSTFAYVLVPPMTSADVLMYTAYGRLTKLGVDPFVVSPAAYYQGSWDPVLKWMEAPWQDQVNVYGPVLVGLQWLANVLGGDSVHDIVFWFQLLLTLFFVAASVVVYRMAADDEVLKTRALLFTVACPSMVWAIVAGAHNEAVGLCFAIFGLSYLRKNPFLVGLFIGVGCTAKVTVALYGLGMAWAYRRSLKKFLLSMLGAAIPNVIAYIILFPEALKAAAGNTSYVASSSWVFPIRIFVGHFLEGDAVQTVVSLVTYGAAILLGWMLSRVLPWRAAPGLPEGERVDRDPLTSGLRATVIIGSAYLITSAYTLPWYDLAYFMPLALLGPNKLDYFGITRVTALNLAYVLGRVLPLTEDMSILSTRAQQTLGTSVALGVMLGIAMWWNERGVRVGSHVRPHQEGEPGDPQIADPPAQPAPGR